jgi:endonuclease/exonuclease/phosphatase family metal-dependent hydrolase
VKSRRRAAEKLALWTQAEDEREMTRTTVRCITLNTWKNEGDYAARLPAMGAGLSALRPDVVLLQEVFRAEAGNADTARVLGQDLGMAVAYAPAREKFRSWHGGDVASESGLAVLIRGQVLASERLPLPSDEAGGERIALLVRARLEVGVEVVVGCVHLSHLRGDEARRREQLETVLADACWRTAAALRVLGGDFNAPMESEALAWLAIHPQFRITEVGADLGLFRTTHPLPPRAERPGRRIDALFSIGMRGEPSAEVLDGGVALDTPVRGVWASDHAAVWADLSPVGQGR